MKTLILTLIFLINNTILNAQMMESDEVYKTKSLGFSQSISSNGFIFLSGQVGWDTNYKFTGDGDFKAQATQAMKNISLILKNANLSMDNIVQLKIYVTDISIDNKLIINKLLNEYFLANHKPTSTLLCVKALAREDILIEIETIASKIK